MSISQTIKKEILSLLQKVGVKVEEKDIAVPPDQKMGDFSFPCFTLGKELNKNPAEIAKELAGKIKTGKLVVSAKAFGPYLNFFINQEKLSQLVLSAIQKEKSKYGNSALNKNKKVIIEYTDPNPFKVFHIGHLMTNAIGESLARLLEASGAKVKRANYQGDVGMHVGKTIWGILERKEKMPGESEPLEKRIAYMGRAYVLGAAEFDVNEKAKEEIKEVNRKVYNREDKKINAIYDLGRQWSLDYFELIYKKLGTKFDYYFFESQTATAGKKLVEKYLKAGVFESSQGAIIFPGEKYGVHTRVFINSEGLPTYEAKDLGLSALKEKKYPSELSLIITANEQNDYFAVVLKALAQINTKLAERTKHIGHGMMCFAEGKMASRRGNVISGESLMKEAVDLAFNKIKDQEMSTTEKAAIAEKVGIGALKYAILKQALGNDIVYTPETAVSFEGDAGPYLQYTYTRINSILKKAGKVGKKIDYAKLNSPEEKVLIKALMNFPDALAKAVVNFDPSEVAKYLHSLAKEFSSFYHESSVLKAEEGTREARLALLNCLKIVLEKGLGVLGIGVVERM